MRRRRVAPWIAAGVALVVVLLVAVAATSEPAEQRIADSPLVGKRAPATTGESLTEYSTTLAELRGKYVVVNFFATWCVPCRKEHPELVSFATRHAARGDAAVLQVVYGDRDEAVRKFMDKNGGDWPVLADPKGAIALDWGVRGLPESYVVDPDGVVQAKVIGGATDDFLEALLRQLEEQT